MRNRKGFLLSEALVVATVLLTALVVIYAQYAKVYLKMKSTKNYNTGESSYIADQISDYFTSESQADALKTCLGNADIKSLDECSEIVGLSSMLSQLDVTSAYVGKNVDDLSSVITPDDPNKILWDNYLSFLEDKLPNRDTSACKPNKYFIFVRTSDNEFGYSYFNYTIYTESLLNGNDPAWFCSGLIPVVYDGTNWEVADTTQEWYKYESKRWANAVAVNPAQKYLYFNKQGTDIPMSDIRGFFVWIPRFKYAIPAGTGAREMAVTFETGTLTTGTKTTSPSTNTLATLKSNPSHADFITHPAFKLGNDQVSGFWYGKFESSYAGTTSKATDTTRPQSSYAPNVTATNVRILPNEYAWNYVTMKNAFLISKEVSYAYGILGDSHVSKNNEWAAVSDLTYSVYGQNTELCNNNDAGFKTGTSSGVVSGLNTASKYAYNTTQGYCASTTGNIYGIYDMSGGAWDHVMGAMTVSGNTAIAYDDSGLDSSILPFNSKYVNLFPYGTVADDWGLRSGSSQDILGQNIRELCYNCANSFITWNDDMAGMVKTSGTSAWLVRGNSSINATPTATGQGIFSFLGWIGGNHANGTFRMSFMPEVR